MTAVEQAGVEERSSDELVGQLAGELARLLRGELELSVARRGPELRRVGVELAAAAVAGVAALLALAALSWAGGLALARVVPSWAAALVVAGAWGLAALALARLDHFRHLLQRLAADSGSGALDRAGRERDDAEQSVRETAEELGRAMSREAAERGVEGAEEAAGAAEQEGEDVLKELLVAMLAPGRAGLSLLESVLARRGRVEPNGSALPQRKQPEATPPGA